MRRLLIRPGAIGDCIVSLPAMESLREDYLEAWVAGQNVPLIRFADRVRPIAATGIDLLGLPEYPPPRALLENLASFDSIISWYGANRNDFRAAVEKLGLPFHFFPALPPEASGMHAVDFYLRQIQPFSVRKVARQPRIECRAAEHGCAIIHPFSGSPRKNWPMDRFREIEGYLRPRMPVKWCAGPEEELADAERFDDLYRLAGWLAGSRCYIGNDSGITHLAAASGARVVALFGPTDPDVWAPRGAYVRIAATVKAGEPMECLSKTAVISAIAGVLSC